MYAVRTGRRRRRAAHCRRGGWRLAAMARSPACAIRRPRPRRQLQVEQRRQDPAEPGRGAAATIAMSRAASPPTVSATAAPGRPPRRTASSVSGYPQALSPRTMNPVVGFNSTVLQRSAVQHAPSTTAPSRAGPGSRPPLPSPARPGRVAARNPSKAGTVMAERSTRTAPRARSAITTSRWARPSATSRTMCRRVRIRLRRRDRVGHHRSPSVSTGANPCRRGLRRHGPFSGLMTSGWHTAGIAMRLIVDHYLSQVASLASPRAISCAGRHRCGPALLGCGRDRRDAPVPVQARPRHGPHPGRAAQPARPDRAQPDGHEPAPAAAPLKEGSGRSHSPGPPPDPVDQLPRAPFALSGAGQMK